jgi:xanthine dehydrogenase accessory factor
MNRQISIWKFVKESFEKNIPVMLLYVLESSGSSPGRQGFFMAVNANKEMEGSIGGGIMEHKFVEMAKEKLQEIRNKEHKITNEKVTAEIRKQIHDKAVGKNQSGMICSGEQTIFLYQISEKDIDAVEKLIASLEQNKNGTLHLSANGILFENIAPSKDFDFNLNTDEDPIAIGWSYSEKTGFNNHLYIVGGGHCALAFSKLMSTMDFDIHLFEDREQLNTVEKNNYANEKTIVKDYSELKELIPAGENSYVVVMTFGYRTDDIAVRALINKDFKYFGLLGSQKKIEKLFEEYCKESISNTLKIFTLLLV